MILHMQYLYFCPPVPTKVSCFCQAHKQTLDTVNTWTTWGDILVLALNILEQDQWAGLLKFAAAGSGDNLFIVHVLPFPRRTFKTRFFNINNIICKPFVHCVFLSFVTHRAVGWEGAASSDGHWWLVIRWVWPPHMPRICQRKNICNKLTIFYGKIGFWQKTPLKGAITGQDMSCLSKELDPRLQP